MYKNWNEKLLSIFFQKECYCFGTATWVRLRSIHFGWLFFLLWQKTTRIMKKENTKWTILLVFVFRAQRNMPRKKRRIGIFHWTEDKQKSLAKRKEARMQCNIQRWAQFNCKPTIKSSTSFDSSIFFLLISLCQWTAQSGFYSNFSQA